MRTTRGEAAPCPLCGYLIDSITEAYGDGIPEAGDISICFGCAGVLICTGNGPGVRAATEAERAEAMANDDVRRAVGGVLSMLATGEGGRRPGPAS